MHGRLRGRYTWPLRMAVTQVVPLGEGVKRADVKKSSLLYNEYIVYDVSQIKARYLVQMKFNYK